MQYETIQNYIMIPTIIMTMDITLYIVSDYIFTNLRNPCLTYPTPPPRACGGVGAVFEARIKRIAALK